MSLEDAGFKVDTFNDPANTLKNFKPYFYDLLILDIVTPDMDDIKLYY
jgi:DNA-binding response OmpR family regulator